MESCINRNFLSEFISRGVWLESTWVVLGKSPVTLLHTHSSWHLRSVCLAGYFSIIDCHLFQAQPTPICLALSTVMGVPENWKLFPTVGTTGISVLLYQLPKL